MSVSPPLVVYSNIQVSCSINNPIIPLIPTNSGGALSPKLKISTLSGATNSEPFPKDGFPNISTYKFPNSVSAKADGSLVVVDDWSQTIRVINNLGISSTLAGKYEVISGTLQTGFIDGQESDVGNLN